MTDELDALRDELRQLRGNVLGSGHIDVDPQGVEQGLAQLVLTLVEFVRQLLERQAVRRMEGGSLSEEEEERVGLALMKLEEKIHELAAQFGIAPGDLNINLGPLGELL
jgi:gas vesicle protein GvpK